MALIAMEKVEKCYTTGCRTVHALSGIDLTVERGEMVAILGRSGSGKSTLMNLLGCLDTPTAGHYRLDGQPVDEMTPGQLARVRSRTVGFVFQSFHLLPGLTALENVALPLSYRGLPQKRREQIAAAQELELGTVKSRISRGRTLLRNFLSVSGNFFENAASKVTECNREGMSAK